MLRNNFKETSHASTTAFSSYIFRCVCLSKLSEMPKLNCDRQYCFVPAHMLKNDNKMVCASAKCLECGLSAHQSSVISKATRCQAGRSSAVLLELELGVAHSQLLLCLKKVVECDDSYYMDSPPKIK